MQGFTATFKSEGMLPIIGLSLPLAWIYAAFLSNETFYIFFHLSFGCTLIVIALLYQFRGGAGAWGDRFLPWIAAVLMAFAPLSVYVLPHNSLSLLILSACLCGAGGAYCFCRWFQVLCAFPLRNAVNHTLIAFSISACIRLLLVILFDTSYVAVCSILIFLPFLSTLLMKKSLGLPTVVKALEQEAAKREFKEKPGAQTVFKMGFAGIVIELVIYGLIFGVLRNGISEWSSSASSLFIGHLLRIILPLLLLAWLSARKKSRWSDTVLRAIVLALAILLLAAVFFGNIGASVLSALVLAERSFVSVLIYLLLFEAMRRTKMHPCVAYGIGRAVYELSLVVGLILYDQAMALELFESLPFSVMYFGVACVFLLLLNSFSRSTRFPHTKSLENEVSQLDLRCNQLAGVYVLTERELEVMKMMAKGRSKKHIAQNLYLSEDTIRWHTKQLYRKLDIHNRQELLTLIGVE